MDDGSRTVLRAIRSADLGLVIPADAQKPARCVSCGREVPEAEVGGFVKAKDGVIIFCYRPECLEYVMGGGR